MKLDVGASMREATCRVSGGCDTGGAPKRRSQKACHMYTGLLVSCLSIFSIFYLSPMSEDLPRACYVRSTRSVIPLTHVHKKPRQYFSIEISKTKRECGPSACTGPYCENGAQFYVCGKLPYANVRNGKAFLKHYVPHSE